jgi:hypothetical protein
MFVEEGVNWIGHVLGKGYPGEGSSKFHKLLHSSSMEFKMTPLDSKEELKTKKKKTHPSIDEFPHEDKL